MRTLEETRPSFNRLLKKVSKLKEDENGCVNWTFAKDENGYGIFVAAGKPWLVHRVLLFLHTNRDPGLRALHSCGNPSCVNRRHLYWGTGTSGSKGERRAPLGKDEAMLVRRFLERHPPRKGAQGLRVRAPSTGSVSFLARWFDVDRQAISRIFRRAIRPDSAAGPGATGREIHTLASPGSPRGCPPPTPCR